MTVIDISVRFIYIAKISLLKDSLIFAMSSNYVSKLYVIPLSLAFPCFEGTDFREESV